MAQTKGVSAMAVRKRTRKSKNGQKKSVIFEAEVYVRGVRVAYKAFDTRASAEAWHEETKARNETGQPTNQSLENATFGDCFNRYVAERIPQLRLQTQQTTANRFKYVTESPLMTVRIRDFSDRTIDLWFSWLRQHPTTKDPGRKSFKQEFRLLRAILYWYRNYVDPMFVVPVVKRHIQQTHFKPVAARRPDYFMRREDIQNWIDWLVLHRKNPSYHRLATFMILTGTRVSEAAGLHWDVVDFDNEIASIVRTVWWDHHTKAPNIQTCAKNSESIRVVKLSEPVLKMLKAAKKEDPSDGPVFKSTSGGILRYPAIQNAFNSGFFALGLPWRSTHICRHSFGTLALMASRDLSAVQAALGHRDIRETQGYAKVVALVDGKASRKAATFIDLDVRT